MLYPDGVLLKMPLEMLRGTPFQDYFAPGVLLLLTNGIIPFVAVAGLLTKRPKQVLPGFGIFGNQHWAWSLSLISGIVLIVWIIVQITMIGFWREYPLQALCLTEGVLISLLTLLPNVRKTYELSTGHKNQKI